uniref:Uncharacterized protein n=1 Tax=uncultured marine microorganism HF4000_APKG8C21 TaxID=455553 RepID=B3TA29_9ZZZZ|nr:hypothetical protein ALOHA_HF4000APKG8C21ctg1g26 [uncultured marine microorganism HF4000_APKG8C21]
MAPAIPSLAALFFPHLLGPPHYDVLEQSHASPDHAHPASPPSFVLSPLTLRLVLVHDPIPCVWPACEHCLPAPWCFAPYDKDISPTHP